MLKTSKTGTWMSGLVNSSSFAPANPGGPGGPGGPGSPLSPRFFFKSCSFQAIWAIFGLNPHGVKTPLALWLKSWIRAWFICFSEGTTAANFPTSTITGERKTWGRYSTRVRSRVSSASQRSKDSFSFFAGRSKYFKGHWIKFDLISARKNDFPAGGFPTWTNALDFMKCICLPLGPDVVLHIKTAGSNSKYK